MLVGQKDKELKVFSSLRALLDNSNLRSGFTIVELMVAALILMIVLAGLYWSLNSGQIATNVTKAKLELEADIRLAMDWITKDLRQSISWNIAGADNNPTTSHLKFNLWLWNATTHTWDVTTSYVEYNYDSVAKTITRVAVDGTGNVMSFVFNNIEEPPFYTQYIDTGDPGNVLVPIELQSNKKLIVVISGRKLVRAGLFVNSKLKLEVRIRNG